MHKSILAMTAAVALAFAVTTASEAFARGPGGFGGGPGGGPGFAGPGGGAATWQSPPGFGKGRKIGWQGKSTPPGWSKGNKTGWNGYKVPPGLYGHL